MIDKEKAKEEIKLLVQKYQRIKESGKIKDYNEERTKKEFIEPLFEALGWDVRNKFNDDEVLVEEKISKGRVDYSFRLNGIPKFFIEAKALKVDLDNIKFVQQAIDYAWHKSCTWAILTDFEGLKIYNAEWKNQNPLQSIFLSFRWDNYLERFEKLWWLSKESFEKGILDKEAEELGKKIKKISVDEQLLQDLTKFRELLTKNILKNNASRNLSETELDESVQRIIDRLIFIRVCEDKQLEEPILQPLIREEQHKKFYKKLNEIFVNFDNIYNSKLFSFHLCQDLIIDNDVLEKVIKGLFKTQDESIRYDFSAIDADVLGNIYEQYLGHLLKKTAKRAKLSKGQAHRKEQGIYYTPTYVVDYIVKNTVGELAKDKKFDLKNIKVLDPACGSGSFLIKAFDYLVTLDKKKNGDVDQTKLDITGESATYGKKVEILKNNIFGVDLDPKAVEIAQLNLLLKAAEKKHRLPMLQENIKVGNSLIDNKEYSKRAFKWEEEFKEIIDEGGFDVVIGNPPYVRIQTLNKKEVGFFNSNFKSATKNYDIYALFVEKGVSLLREGGLLGFILPSKFFNADYGLGLRNLIASNKNLNKVLDFKDFQVFEGATTYTCLLFLKKSKNENFSYLELSEPKKLKNSKIILPEMLKSSKQKSPLENTPWNFFSDESKSIMNKLNKVKLKLKDVCAELFVGLQTSADPIYIVSILNEEKDKYEILCRKTKKKYKIEKDIVKPILMGKDIKRWAINWRNLGLIFPYNIEDGKASLIEEEIFKKKYPLAWNYFSSNKKILDLREKGKWKNRKNWHAFVYEKNLASFSQPKLLTQVLSSKNAFTIDDKGTYYFVGGGNAGGYGLTLKKEYSGSEYAILAILNSRLLEFYLQGTSTPFRGGFYSYGKRFIENLPIIIPNHKEKERLETHAKKQIELNETLNKIKDKVTDEKMKLEKEIKEIEIKINEEINKIYGLSQKEIEIVRK